MLFEHCALNVPDAAAHARWYMDHCGLTARRSMDTAPFCHFLEDTGGRVVLEIYTNPDAPWHNFKNMDPLTFHLALVCDDPAAKTKELEAAGAEYIKEDNPEPGSVLIMLRDPWGVPLQLCKRAKPF